MYKYISQKICVSLVKEIYYIGSGLLCLLISKPEDSPTNVLVQYVISVEIYVILKGYLSK